MDYLASNADPLLALGSMVFTLLLLPTIIAQLRGRASTIPLTTSVPTVGVFGVFVTVYLALSLPMVAVVEALQAVLWGVIAFQRWRYGAPGTAMGDSETLQALFRFERAGVEEARRQSRLDDIT
jgi:hypothetical protein